MNVWKFVLCVGLALVLPTQVSAQSNEPPKELVQALVKLDAGFAQGYKANDPVSANSRATVLQIVPAAREAKVSFTEKGAFALVSYLGSERIAATILKTKAPPEPVLNGNRRRFAHYVLAHTVQEDATLMLTEASVSRLASGVQTASVCPCWPIC